MTTDISSKLLKTHGLWGQVSINIDRWGVPHIRAENVHDLFFAQGWNAARDRLWQIDLARKRGLGLLSRDFGPGYLAQDRASRLFLYRGDMASEWKAYGSDSEEICTAFTSGINAYIDGCDAGLLDLPPEFAVLGNRPDRWKPEDVVRVRTHSLTQNASSELLRSKVMAVAGPKLGAKLDVLRKHLSHGRAPAPSDGFDPEVMSDRVLRDYQLARCPVTFSKERLYCSLDESDLWTVVVPPGEIARSSFEEGSNNWAISAEKTSTGRPILAFDPHRTHTLPSIRYVVHLTMSGLDVIGAGEPMVPGVSMGHNGTAAFALTIFGADQEDIYVYETASDDPESYAYDGGREKFRVVEEVIPVKGFLDQPIGLHFTRHGPVVYQDKKNNRAFGLRTVWMDPGMAPYMASLSVMRAKTYREYERSLEGWGCPSVNHVYADTSNTIAWRPVGAAPVRDNWDGLLPVPGDGRFEWRGYLGPSDGPTEINPARGFIATANAMNVPDDWSRSNRAIAYEWLDSSRHDTLHYELSRDKLFSLEDCIRLQCSTFSPIAARIAKTGTKLFRDAGDLPIWEFLRPWDNDLSADSAPAALFEVWLSKHLGPLVARREGASAQVIPLLMPFDAPSIAAWLENAVPDRELVEALQASLMDAWTECSTLMGGEEPANWSWGRLHKLYLRHPLQSLVTANWSLEAMRLGGSSSTLNYATYRLGDFSISGGPSVRMIIDVGNWDESLFINNPGQSGVPGSTHYADLTSSWRQGEYKPLLYSMTKVEEATASRIDLVPS
ncbi:MAG: penicillin acylase family protein [Mesorhizobium sp.]|uniref:penicillin acylase family protein n=1 Tax=Mesorhizobium sp. TaxID=1871066 RepID=UPI000FE3BFBA|nr:penicillin acylase family protein [Mesorhizobium sp.]RWG76704.1 MAG: penicillin acylase family protein [Mesorhizobium sp.]RWI41198.1 MAG: penicillin acylase family protein [Mesorhizobium sp.]RWJ20693.1 MAG: penicillin acylase family protein [Mesorhizobium sp.]RWJ83365.1 MAG: penicillin acylase family protein [Mesorhizobium sp.]RWK12436.1 MAG: penicillin acylase family protein [Mesorhizobium sp.]